MTEHVFVDTTQGVMSIRLNRPEKKNALSQAMYAAIADAFAQAETDDTVRVILLAGTDDCFTAGNDLLDFLNNPPSGEDSPVARFLNAISQAHKPVVAAVEGVAVGVGTTMLLHCDLVYAGESAKLQLPFVNLALVPEAGSSRLLPDMLGHRRAAELLMLGEMFDARRAIELGIVNAVCPDSTSYSYARERALALAAKPPEAVRLTKELMKRGSQEAVREQMQAEMTVFRARLGSPEAQEAMLAFMERRVPDFSKFS
ncbi:MAG TPA: enoyl-CoA hydratase [Gammaproteobacteria bacterium]|nr:enoyl-CoA hydratase [Gammaproteobacteria bacterium]